MEEQVASSTKKRKKLPVRAIVVAGIIALVGITGFVSGMQYQKGKSKSSSSNFTAQGEFSGNGQFAGGPSGRMGEFGTVTAVTSSSISVKSQRTDTTKTYTINGSTTITNNGSTATYSDISVGDTVMVVADSSTSTTASRIIINPSMSSGPMMDSSGSDFGSSVTTN